MAYFLLVASFLLGVLFPQEASSQQEVLSLLEELFPLEELSHQEASCPGKSVSSGSSRGSSRV